MSLLEGPLLVGDLPEARVFSRKNWLPRVPKTALNLEQKLGHLYEDALALVLGEDLLEQNLQLRKDIHTTVGELDFLLCSKNDGPLIHLELATKFYLAVNRGYANINSRLHSNIAIASRNATEKMRSKFASSSMVASLIISKRRK